MKIFPIIFLIITTLILGVGCSSKNGRPLPVTLTDDNVNQYISDQQQAIKEDDQTPIHHYNLARAFYFQKNYKLAIHSARDAVRLEPLNAEHYELLGSIAYSSQRYSDAMTELSTAIKISPENISAYLKLAATYEAIGDDSRAITALEEVIQKDRYYVDALFHLGRIYLKQREFDGALHTLERLLKLEPQDKTAMLLRIQTYSHKGNHYYAETLAKEMLESFPDYVPTRRELLRILFAQKKWKEARMLLTDLRSKGPLATEDQLIEAYLLLYQKQENESRIRFEKILEKQPKNVDAMMGLAVQLLRRGYLDEALTWLTRALEINANLAKTHFLRASILFRQGDYLQGDLAINRALELDPANPAYQLLFLRRQLMQGELAVVEKQLRLIQEKHPLNVEALQLQADLHISRNQPAEAEKLLRQAMLVNESPSIHFSLARVLYQQGKYRSTLVVTNPLKDTLSGNWEVIYLHALALSRAGKYEQALQQSKAYLVKKESQGYAHRLVGDLLRFQGKESEAQKIYQEGLVLFPGHLHLIEGLSASLVMTESWEAAQEILETTLEQNQTLEGNPPLHLLLLDRLVMTYQRLKMQDKKIAILRQFHKKNDPLNTGQLHSLEEQLLFPISLPSLDKSLSPLLFSTMN